MRLRLGILAFCVSVTAIAGLPAMASALILAPSPFAEPTGMDYVQQVETGDNNRDGRADVFVSAAGTQLEGGGVGDGGVYLWIADGDGKLDLAPDMPIRTQGDIGGYALEVGDFNEDEYVDFIVQPSTWPRMERYLGQPDGTFEYAGDFQTGLPMTQDLGDQTGMADFNGDGNIDFAAVGFNLNGVSLESAYAIALGDGEGDFTPLPVQTVNLPGAGALTDVAVGDYDGDDELDLAMINYPPSPLDQTNPEYKAIYALAGVGDGTFTDVAASPFQLPAAAAPPAGGLTREASNLAAGDFDGDGRDDLAATDLVSRVEILEGSATSFLVPRPSAGFDTALANNTGLAVGDFDSFRTNPDSPDDIAAIGADFELTDTVPPVLSTDPKVSVGLGDGEGAFVDSPEGPYEIGPDLYPTDMTIGDIDGNGYNDVIELSSDVQGAGDGFPEGIQVMYNRYKLETSEDAMDFAVPAADDDSTTKTLTISNAGAPPAPVTDIEVFGGQAQFFSVDPEADCTVGVMKGSPCSLPVRYTPTTMGAKDATLRLTLGNEADANFVDVNLHGADAEPTWTIDPLFVDFGRTPVGDSATEQTATLTNTSGITMEMGTAYISGDDGFEIAGSECDEIDLEGGDSCEVELGFSPETIGEKNSIIVVPVAGTSAAGRALAGFGTESSAAIAWPEGEPESVEFEDVNLGESRTIPVTVENDGDGTLSFGDIALSGDTPSSVTIAGDQCTDEELAPDETCEVTLTMEPTETGPVTGTLSIEHFGSNPPLEVTINGRGIDPGIQVAPAGHDFGTGYIGETDGFPSQSFEVRSTGETELWITNPVTITGPDAGDFRLVDPDGCDGPQQPGDTCAFKVDFLPKGGSPSARTAALVIPTNATGAPETVVNLTGTAADRPDLPGDPPSDPPADPQATLRIKAPKKPKPGKTLKIKATVKNTGAVDLGKVTFKTTGPRFVLKKAIGSKGFGSLAAGSSKTVTIKVPTRKYKGKRKKAALKVAVLAGGQTLAKATHRMEYGQALPSKRH